MERAEYEKLREAEGRLWWFAAVHANLAMLYRRAAPHCGEGERVLDAGCGTGGFLTHLSHHLPRRQTFGVDADETACRWAAQRSGRPVCAGSIDAMPFPDASFAAIFSVDVLCHRNVDEPRALAQLHRCLATGGVLILNLPAYRWLMSRHDAVVYNARRYTRRGVVRLLRAAGFRPVFTGYWNMLLFPLMVATRKLLPGSGSDVKVQPRLVDVLCRCATGIEYGLMRARFRLPFGGSVLAVAIKSESLHD